MKPGFGMKGGSPSTAPRSGGHDAQPQAVIQVTHRYAVSPACVFDAWVDPDVAGKWLFATASRPITHPDIDARVGGTFRFVDRHAGEAIEYGGEYIEIVPHRRLVFTLVMAPEPCVVTRVTVAIAPLKKGCALKLTHENVPQEHASQIEGRWTGILYGLDVTLDPVSAAVHHDQE
jgi:uncharacterized protein YndB with AHSA1/START domain